MNQANNHLTTEMLKDNLELLFQKKQTMPETVEWSIARYQALGNMTVTECGELNYSFASTRYSKKYLDLQFCIRGNKYCPKNCEGCPIHEVETVDLLTFKFNPLYLKRLVGKSIPETKKEKILSFKYPKAFTQKLDITQQHRSILDGLVGEDKYSGNTLENIFVYAKVNELLHYSITHIADDATEVAVCPFLAEADGINRIYDARDILMQSLDHPITIKELSRKVAINECYLKKGFKEVFGATIFEFYQNKRMEHARYLLYEKGLSVTDAAELLGYSSISHFSSAFKKFTGIKPCELLLQAKI